MNYEYTVQVISSAPFDPETGADVDWDTFDKLPASSLETTAARRPDRRIDRQAQRMSRALAHQTAPDNELTEITGEPPLLSTTNEATAPSYWKSLRRIIRHARKDGYASECIEGAFLYAAFYNATGITDENIKNPKLLEAITTSGILSEEEPHLNALIVNTIPPPERIGACLFLPYYLYSIPQRAVDDMLHGRLVVIVVASQGRVAQALERAGFEVISQPGRSFNVSGSVVGTSGQYRINIPNLPQHFNEMVYEFRSVDYLVGIATSILEAAAKVLDFAV